MATILEILSKPIEERKNAYNVKEKIDEVVIDGQKFSGYKAFSFLWEKSYHKEPVRSSEGVIGNLNDYTTFITPHLKIDFSMMSIDDYRRLMQLVYSKNEFTVTCYDIVNNRPTTNKMYFSTEEMPKLFLLNRALNGESWIELLGIDGYTVEMIGTNADLDTVSVSYFNIDPTTESVKQTYTKDYYVGQEFIVGDGVDFKNANYKKDGKFYNFNGAWDVYELNGKGKWQKTGGQYLDNTALTINKTLALGLSFDETTTEPYYTVSLNYGYGTEKKDAYGNPILSFSIQKGSSFQLEYYTTYAPIVNFLNNECTPYQFRGWYYTPVVVEGSTSLDDTEFDKSHNVLIYQVYDTNTYTLSFETDNGTTINPVTDKYGASVAIPVLTKEGYKFAGWFYEYANSGKSFSGTMPPKNTTIYAKWEKKE